MRIIRPYWPILVTTGLLLVVTGILLARSIRENAGHFVYALDDAYLHMAIARNFARYAVWGVTRYEFSSSTSSPLWTLMLSGAYVITSSPYVPLILNLLWAVLLLVFANSFLLVSVPHNLVRLALLSALVFLVPLPPLILTGMEHITQITLCLILVYSAASVIADKQTSAHKQAKLLLVVAAIAPLVRYESLFLVLVVAVLLGFRRRFFFALFLTAVAVTPLTIYGFVSWKHGSLILPNPLLLKGSVPRAGLLPFLHIALLKLLSAPHLLLLWLLAIWLLLSDRRKATLWHRDRVLMLIFVPATVLHLLFAGVGWFYRYEAYLVALGLIIIGQSLFRLFARKEKAMPERRSVVPVAVTLVVALTTGFLLASRANKALTETVPATKNIYEQQYQMATFLRSYYSGAAVAANDIGAINFMADIRCLDLWGLGSAEVTRAKLAGQYNTQKMDQLARAHHVRIALLYSGWFETEGGVPEQWTKVGQWTIPECVVCGNPVVSFYAVDATETEKLERNLKEFSAQLPTDVLQAGRYYEIK